MCGLQFVRHETVCWFDHSRGITKANEGHARECFHLPEKAYRTNHLRLTRNSAANSRKAKSDNAQRIPVPDASGAEFLQLQHCAAGTQTTKYTNTCALSSKTGMGLGGTSLAPTHFPSPSLPTSLGQRPRAPLLNIHSIS